MRVITPDVGGGFGTKLFHLSRIRAGRGRGEDDSSKPVTWIADRTEHFLGDTHGRDNITTAKLALDDKGRFLALDVDTIADMGAYLSAYAPIFRSSAPACCRASTTFRSVTSACAASIPTPCRSMPIAAPDGRRPSYVIERLVDAAARELDIAPDALRRQELHQADAMPYTTATGKIYDTGEFAGHMARAQKLADWDGFKKRASASQEERTAARHRHRHLYRGLRQQRRPTPRRCRSKRTAASPC